MKLREMIPAKPVSVQKSKRMDEVIALTSAPAGKVLPLAVIPMLREDSLSGMFRISAEMMETAETLMNSVHLTVMAHYVPPLAFERFRDMGQVNRSYMGEPETEGGTPIPYFSTMAFDRDAPFWRTLGVHAQQGETVNATYVEAYNAVINFRRKARSSKLPLRTELDTTLAPAFWKQTAFGHIKPDFEQAMIDGEVDLATASNVPISGIGLAGGTSSPYSVYESNGEYVTYDSYGTPRAKWNQVTGLPEIYAELASDGIKLSLANLELAKKTAAFARIRENYNGVDDEHIIDLLMQGIRVNEAELKNPLLLAKKETIFGYQKRYATDAGNLAQSATNGAASVDLMVRAPAMQMGGVIIITAEIVPDQLHERQLDKYLYTTDTAALPRFDRDWLDPEKVEVVPNKQVDVLHGTPDGTFGYAPLNHNWKRRIPRIGGKFYRPTVDAAFDEDRQRIWAVETVDPQLTEDFWLCNNFHQKVFADTVSDPFEVVTVGAAEITGNTVFGGGLMEATGDYDAVDAIVDKSRIDQGQ